MQGLSKVTTISVIGIALAVFVYLIIRSVFSSTLVHSYESYCSELLVSV